MIKKYWISIKRENCFIIVYNNKIIELLIKRIGITYKQYN